MNYKQVTVYGKSMGSFFVPQKRRMRKEHGYKDEKKENKSI